MGTVSRGKGSRRRDSGSREGGGGDGAARGSAWRGKALAGIAALALLAFALNRCGPQPPLSILCRHRDDPQGKVDFRVDVGRGDDRVRFADGQTLTVKASRDQITFLEKESNSFHLNDNDSDEAALGARSPEERALGIPGTVAPVVVHFDHRHDVEHRTTIDRRSLAFTEHALIKGGGEGSKLMDGQCHTVAAP